jgi:hypothetical protein
MSTVNKSELTILAVVAEAHDLFDLRVMGDSA